MHGIIQNHNHVHKRTVAVTPIVHSYHAPGETPYQKFNCPVCNALGNTKIGLPHGVKQCPLCGVHLEWVRQPQVGDEIIITESVEGGTGINRWYKSGHSKNRRIGRCL